MTTFDAYALTPSSKLLYTVEICEYPLEEWRNIVDPVRFTELCASGCVNYEKKWSCPPFAPLFQDFAAAWERLFVVYMRIETDQLSYIKNDYLKIKAANSILKSRADRFLRAMAERRGCERHCQYVLHEAAIMVQATQPA